MIAVLDAANIVRYASPSTHNVLGYAPDELEGQAATMFVDPDDMAQAQATFAAHLREPGSVRRIEFRVRHKDGSWRMTETIANNRLHDPAVRGIVLNCRDITDRKRAEEALRASEERHRALTEHASDSSPLSTRGGSSPTPAPRTRASSATRRTPWRARRPSPWSTPTTSPACVTTWRGAWPRAAPATPSFAFATPTAPGASSR